MAKITDYLDKLRQQVAEFKEHPFKTTDDAYGCGIRAFKQPLCEWEGLEELKGYTGWNADEYSEKLNGKKDVAAILNSFDGNIFLFPDKGGYLYLGWER